MSQTGFLLNSNVYRLFIEYHIIECPNPKNKKGRERPLPNGLDLDKVKKLLQEWKEGKKRENTNFCSLLSKVLGPEEEKGMVPCNNRKVSRLKEAFSQIVSTRLTGFLLKEEGGVGSQY